MNLRTGLLATTTFALLATGAMAQSATRLYAQPVTGPYVGGGVGGHWSMDQNVKNVTIGNVRVNVGNAEFASNGGAVVIGSAGWGFGNGLRVELEGNWRGNSWHLINAGPIHGGMGTNNYGVLLNALYDFYLGWPVIPYVGAGIGWEGISVHNGHLYDNQGNSIVGKSGSSGSGAAQFIAGAAYPIPSFPGLAMTAEFRFLAGWNQYSIKGVASGPAAGVTGGNFPAAIKVGALMDYGALVGFRYAFNAPPPPPPPAPVPAAAPAPAPVRTYLERVEADWNREPCGTGLTCDS
jgi:OmpA-OmpF porin, OOP family